jgi:hypothetical protein
MFRDLWRQGQTPKNSRKFDNITNPPLLIFSPDKLIIEILSVPQLHILLGKEMKNCISFVFYTL